jgi:hypothetical protein
MVKSVIACTGINKRILRGRLNVDNTAFIGTPVDVTGECIKAIIDKCGVGETMPVHVNGELKYEISVREIVNV